MRLVILLLLGLSAPLAAQQEKDDIGSGCKICHLTGVKPCEKHPKKLVEAEDMAVYCSVAASCEDCGGALLVDCKHCDGGPGNIEMAKRRSKAERFRDQPVPAEELFERPLARVVTDHFDIIIDAHKLKDGSKRMNAHEVAHALGIEGEKAAVMLDEHLGAKLHHYQRRSRLWFWGDQKDHHLVNQKVLGTNDPGAFKLFGPDPAYSAWTGEEGMKNAALDVVSNGVHVGTHLLMSNVFRTQWIGNKKAGWFDVGAAHWYEDALFLRIGTYCIDEADARLDWEGGKWRTPVKKYLMKNRQSLLPALMQKISGTLWGEEHALSWSVYDWLVAHHPEAVKPLLLGYKDGVETRDLFKRHLDMTILDVERAWREWVATTYPAKDPKPRKKL